MIDLRSLQRALGGEISGGQLLCPGPGHSPRDRSLAVRPSPDGDGFVVYSHAATTGRNARTTCASGSDCRDGNRATGATGASIRHGSRPSTAPPSRPRPSAAR